MNEKKKEDFSLTDMAPVFIVCSQQVRRDCCCGNRGIKTRGDRGYKWSYWLVRLVAPPGGFIVHLTKPTETNDCSPLCL